VVWPFGTAAAHKFTATAVRRWFFNGERDEPRLQGHEDDSDGRKTHPLWRSTGLAEADDEVDRHCNHEGAEEVGEQSVPQGDPAGGSG
jgi:hypothetical protein